MDYISQGNYGLRQSYVNIDLQNKPLFEENNLVRRTILFSPAIHCWVKKSAYSESGRTTLRLHGKLINDFCEVHFALWLCSTLIVFVSKKYSRKRRGKDKIPACAGMTKKSGRYDILLCRNDNQMGKSMILAEDNSGLISSFKMAMACSFAPSPFSATGPVQAGQPSLQEQFLTSR